MKIITLIAAIAAGVFICSGAVMAQGTTEEKLSVETVEGAKTIVTDKAFDLFQKSANFLDVRTKAMYNKTRIPGSVNLFYKDKEVFNEAAVTAAFTDKTVPVIVYCGGLYCPLSAPAVEELMGWGYGEVYYYREGLPAWEKDGLPIE
ncbi:MAG: rhodanese-like domain-containing protein [Alphaproteobacteria bacterium]|nr:rhodanese-like domain-containing protein [Alphaproteobacteria bacterium]